MSSVGGTVCFSRVVCQGDAVQGDVPASVGSESGPSTARGQTCECTSRYVRTEVVVEVAVVVMVVEMIAGRFGRTSVASHEDVAEQSSCSGSGAERFMPRWTC